MPQFQLETSVALAASAAVSFVVHYVTRPREGKISLPVTVEEELSKGHDPFDVTTPEDVIDGTPINEMVFWESVRMRKLLIALLLSCIFSLNAIGTGFCVANSELERLPLYGINIAFALYCITIATISVTHNDASFHTRAILHLSALTTTAAVLLTVTIIIPSSSPPGTALPKHTSSISTLDGIWIAQWAVYTIAAVLSFTTPLGPSLHYAPELIYFPKTVETISNPDVENVCGSTGASLWDFLLFSYTTKVVMLGNVATSLEIGDLPIVPANMRSTRQYFVMKKALQSARARFFNWSPKPGSGWGLIIRMTQVNYLALLCLCALAASSALCFYAPYLFLQRLVAYIEEDPTRSDRSWGWVCVVGIFASCTLLSLLTGQLWSLSTTTIQVRLRTQLNSILYQKTLVRKDIASSAPAKDATKSPKDADSEDKEDDNEDNFSSKAQIMTLMTTDVDRVSEFAWHMFTLIDAPIEILIGTLFLYNLLGVSCFFGLAVTCLFLPMNHLAGKIVVKAQDNLMKARDERVSLMNEILGAIRMLKFMAWERSFEARVLKIRAKELKYQKLNYTIETLWNGIWNGVPIVVTLVSFWHFTVVRKQYLSPSIAFTALAVFEEMKFALSALPETFINMLQSLVSLRRIEKYLNGAEVAPVPPLEEQSMIIALQSATVTWPQDRAISTASGPPSAVATPRQKFVLIDMTLNFPLGELSLICGKLGSGKTLLLLSLLGESDLLAGQIICPRSPPDALASVKGSISPDKWIVPGMCAYVPQAAWLRNASIKDNILFNLPLDDQRYQKTLQVCALVSDLEILEDGDQSEIGERGVNLSGGQKARVSLARAVYSRASILLLDDVLSAVDAHTAHHLYHECLRGELMTDRTVILVSHHVQLCAPEAKYVVALDNGSVQFEGSSAGFMTSTIMKSLVQSDTNQSADDKQEAAIEELATGSKDQAAGNSTGPGSETSSTIAPSNTATLAEKKKPRILVEEEKRAVGRISRDIWETYIKACGSAWYWTAFIIVFGLAMIVPIASNGWLKVWSGAPPENAKGPLFYISVYALVTAGGLVINTSRWFVLYHGSIHASTILYKRLLETVLFAKIRFHDTVSRGRLLNRFGKDFEGIDSSLSDNLGRSITNGLSALATFVSITYVGGPPFLVVTIVLGFLYFSAAKIYGQTSRDMRRLDSVTRSPLYSIYGETISGVPVLRAFGASSKFLRDMLRYVDTNSNPYYWMWGVNRWLSVRFNLLSGVVMGAVGIMAVVSPGISASFAGFALAFSSTVTSDMLFLVRRFVSLEQSMVALERVKEYSELTKEPPEFIEPRPPSDWPAKGAIRCEDLVIRYSPELPDVLHHLTFDIQPGEKVGILGRTGSGKSTLALSFFRFVEATHGRILVDDVDISKLGLTDLRTNMTIIPQDPTILSGTLRSTLDVFDEYEDARIYEALRRVHLIPSEDSEEVLTTVNANVFRDLESPVSEGGENFSTGEKQLLCMARAILKRSKVLIMDEATASVDYFTDELIGKTIRHQFAESTILTIAHRLRTVIDYDRVMLLDKGKIVEFDKPAVLLRNTSSQFHNLCKATGKTEFATLKQMAGL